MISNLDEFMEYWVPSGKMLFCNLNISQYSASILMMNFHFFRTLTKHGVVGKCTILTEMPLILHASFKINRKTELVLEHN